MTRSPEWVQLIEGNLNWQELSRKKHADLLYDIRRNAIKTIERFIFIFEGMENATDKPGKQFEQILAEKRYEKVFTSLGRANIKSLSYRVSFQDQKSAQRLITLLTMVGIEFDSTRLLKDRKYRSKMSLELALAKKTPIFMAFISYIDERESQVE